MRIAMLTGEYPPHQGGIGDYTQTLSRALLAHGHDVRVFTAIHDSALMDHISDDVPITNLNTKWRIIDNGRVARTLVDFAPDIVDIQYEPAAFAMRLGVYTLPVRLRRYNLPAVVTWHDLLPPYLFPKAGTLRNRIVDMLATHASGHIFTNMRDQVTLVNRCNDQGHALTYTANIPIGSNIAVAPPRDYQPERWRFAQGYQPDAIVIGFFGFRNATKGLEHLVDALADLRTQGIKAHLLFIGGDTGSSDPANIAYSEKINSRIAESNLHAYVKSTGFAPQEDISAALLGIDICALPYLEGANLRHGTLHAALAHGCAIITTRSPEGVSALKDDQALLIKPGETAALVAAIKQMIHKPELRKTLGTNAQTFAQQFTWPAIATQTTTFYEKIINHTEANPPEGDTHG